MNRPAHRNPAARVADRTTDGVGWAGRARRARPLHRAVLGYVREPIIITDAEGYARNSVILGPIPGPHLFEATTAGMPTVTFRATATTGPPFRITALSGGNQQGTWTGSPRRAHRAGERCRRQFHLRGSGYVGGRERRRSTGSRSTQRPTLTAWPLASRLGTLPSTNSIRVTATGFPVFVDFRARALAGPASIIESISGNEQTGLPGGTLAPFTVLVTDEFRNPLLGVKVRWRVLDGGGEVGNDTTTTDMSGHASVTYQLSNLPGTAHIRAEVASSGIGTTFTATAAEPPT